MLRDCKGCGKPKKINNLIMVENNGLWCVSCYSQLVREKKKEECLNCSNPSMPYGTCHTCGRKWGVCLEKDLKMLRSKFAEHLVLEAAAGLCDYKWQTQAHAFIHWCWAQEHLPSETECSDCSHAGHSETVCGQPIEGGYPHLRACLCRSKDSPHTTPQKEVIAVSLGALRFAFEWMDEALELLTNAGGCFKEEMNVKRLRLIDTKANTAKILGIIAEDTE